MDLGEPCNLSVSPTGGIKCHPPTPRRIQVTRDNWTHTSGLKSRHCVLKGEKGSGNTYFYSIVANVELKGIVKTDTQNAVVDIIQFLYSVTQSIYVKQILCRIMKGRRNTCIETHATLPMQIQNNTTNNMVHVKQTSSYNVDR